MLSITNSRYNELFITPPEGSSYYMYYRASYFMYLTLGNIKEISSFFAVGKIAPQKYDRQMTSFCVIGGSN